MVVVCTLKRIEERNAALDEKTRIAGEPVGQALQIPLAPSLCLNLRRLARCGAPTQDLPLARTAPSWPRIGGQAWRAGLDPHGPTGGREYDASLPRPAHGRDRGTSEIEWRADADRDHAVPNVALGFRKARKDDKACIVHKRIDATVSGNGEFGNALTRAGNWAETCGIALLEFT